MILLLASLRARFLLGPGCIEGSIRLADGDSYNSGRVELCYNESWSTVADVTPDTANMICKQLGFTERGFAK